MSLDGSRIVVGANRNAVNGFAPGQVLVYEFSDGNWMQIGGHFDGEAARDRFGSSVATSSDGN